MFSINAKKLYFKTGSNISWFTISPNYDTMNVKIERCESKLSIQKLIFLETLKDK